MKNKKFLFRAKKAFTLLEVVISITIFMIILLFLYKTLDDTKLTNDKFESYIHKKDKINNIYKILSEDIAETQGEIEISTDKDKNSFVRFKSNNSFNNAFYTNITYMISSSANLIRIESKDAFNKEKSGLDFYENSFIDTLLEDIEKFVVFKTREKSDKIVFIIKQKNKEEMIFSTYIMNNREKKI